MRVLLVCANTETINMPVLPLGLACIARATQEAGHEVRIINLMHADDVSRVLKESIREFGPDVIGISVRNIDDQVMAAPRFLLDPVKSMISVCREATGSPIVIGGAGYSIFPASALDYLGADMGIQGEGEQSFVLLLESLEQRKAPAGIPGLYLPGKGLQAPRTYLAPLDDRCLPRAGEHLRFPERLEGQVVWVPFQTRRGCSFECSYCSTALIEGKVLRRYDPGRAAQVLAGYVHAGFDHFFFVDNTFNLPPSYAKSFCDHLIAQNLAVSWRCILYPWQVDEELVEKMATAGCTEVSLGFESGSPAILRAMNKRFSPDDVREISGMLKRHALGRTGFLLLGGPGETRETVMESLGFADSLGLEAMKITVGIRIYPHTALAQLAVNEGVIRPEEDLLLPRFYLARGLEPWIHETVQEWMRDRPNWIS